MSNLNDYCIYCDTYNGAHQDDCHLNIQADQNTGEIINEPPQINAVTRKPYEGGNQEILQMVFDHMHYSRREWLTYVQARNNDRTVKKGSKGIPIMICVPDKDDHTKKIIKRAHVFNIEQTEICRKE